MPPKADAAQHEKLLRAWQLSILRFAVTLDESDRLNVLALAAEVDRLGRRHVDDSLHFFRRTSAGLCAAILGERDDANVILRRFHEAIDDPRLTLAFAAATGIAPAPPRPTRKHARRDHGLFQGLPVRHGKVARPASSRTSAR
jgi:hypothetical protein